MATYQQVKGLSVVTMKAGKKVGAIDEILTDKEGHRVCWLRVGDGGLFSGGRSSWVPAEAIHGIGEHAVTIDAEDSLGSDDAAPGAVELAKSGHHLVGKKVITDTGNYLGTIRDYNFSPDDFALTSLSIARDAGPFSHKTVDVPIDYLLSAGQDVVIVAEQTAQAWSENEPDRTTEAG